MAYVKFHDALPFGTRLKSLFQAASSSINVSAGPGSELASFYVPVDRRPLQVLYRGPDLGDPQGSVSSILFGTEANPWIAFGNASDLDVKFSYTRASARFSSAASPPPLRPWPGTTSSSVRHATTGWTATPATTPSWAVPATTRWPAERATTPITSRAGPTGSSKRGSAASTRSSAASTTSLRPVPRSKSRGGTREGRGRPHGQRRGEHPPRQAGANVLDGGHGRDILEGGRGNDTYYVDNRRDLIIENAGGGSDTLHSQISYVLDDRAVVERLMADGTGAISLTGSRFGNRIDGNTADNTLKGMGGNDSSTETKATTGSRAAAATTCCSAARATTSCRGEPARTRSTEATMTISCRGMPATT